MRNFNIKKVWIYLKDKITLKIIAILLISSVILYSWFFLYENHVKMEEAKAELLKESIEDKKLIDYKNKIKIRQEKIKIRNQNIKEMQIDNLKDMNFEECFKVQVWRMINWQESLINYCEDKFSDVKEILTTDKENLTVEEHIPEVSKTIDHIVEVNKKVEKKSTSAKNAPVEKEYEYYFTNYDLWDVWQNDSTPCIWASGKDLCYLHQQGINTMALVNIKRKEMWIEFWDKVELTWWPCEWIYQVEDEMNIRFRQKTPIYKPWTKFEIRWDIARYGHKLECGGAYTIKKV